MRESVRVCVCVLLAVLALGPGLASVLQATGQENPVQVQRRQLLRHQQGRQRREVVQPVTSGQSRQTEAQQPTEGPPAPSAGPSHGADERSLDKTADESRRGHPVPRALPQHDSAVSESVESPPDELELGSLQPARPTGAELSKEAVPADDSAVSPGASMPAELHQGGSRGLHSEGTPLSTGSKQTAEMDVISRQPGGQPVSKMETSLAAHAKQLPELSEYQKKQEERRRRFEKIQRDLLEKREERKKAMAAATDRRSAPDTEAAPGSPQGGSSSPGTPGDEKRDRARSMKPYPEDDLELNSRRQEESFRKGRKSSRIRQPEQEFQSNSLTEDWDPRDFSDENTVEWDGWVCPATGDVPLLAAQCRTDKDCLQTGERCCNDGWGHKRCVQGVEPILPEIPHEPFFGVIARVCPRQDDTIVEPWAVTNCTTDDDCWPRVCCVDGPRAYCRTPQIEWEKLPGQRFVAPLRSLMSYLQCTPPPPPMFDLFPKPCRNTLDCFPNLCCQEHGNKVCRPPKRSLLALLTTIGQNAGFYLSSQQQQPRTRT